MMKKSIALLLSLLTLLGLCACGGTNAPMATPTVEPAGPTAAPTQPASGDTKDADGPVAGEAPTDAPSSGTNILVVYFSRTGEQYTVGVIDEGNTAIVAKMIAEKTGADLYEILTETDYPYTYSELTDVAKKEQNEKARPAIKAELPDVSQYDTIFIGAPVWWGDWPMILYTFFESADLSGKNLVPFSTHEGSGLSGFDKKLASAVPDATVLTGQAFRGNDCQNKKDSVSDTVDKWLSGLGL
ncbi:MAG: NAD(P)H-dependent oxidoreductase [Oscillospiraceae bacterium]|nr:NAD(P)H-dependent oxidoreductase [Oscillospiraceae bacterium]